MWVILPRKSPVLLRIEKADSLRDGKTNRRGESRRLRNRSQDPLAGQDAVENIFFDAKQQLSTKGHHTAAELLSRNMARQKVCIETMWLRSHSR